MTLALLVFAYLVVGLPVTVWMIRVISRLDDMGPEPAPLPAAAVFWLAWPVFLLMVGFGVIMRHAVKASQ